MMARNKPQTYHAIMLVARTEEWCVEAASPEEARALSRPAKDTVALPEKFIRWKWMSYCLTNKTAGWNSKREGGQLA